MKEKLIVTLWKAQIKNFSNDYSVYCRMTYSNEERNSKPTSNQKNLTWKETFVFSLGKAQIPLKLEFIKLVEGQTVHFAKPTVAESLSFGKSIVNISLNQANRGSLPCKVDILDDQESALGKIFIEYQIIKTEVTYMVERQMDYLYLLKLSGFRVSFIRGLKKIPNLYLKLTVEGKVQKEDFAFDEDNGSFIYNYPVKLYLKKEMQMEIQLLVKDFKSKDFTKGKGKGNQQDSSFTESVISEKKTERSSIGKKEKNLLELGEDRITAIMDLNFKKDGKTAKKIPLTVPYKFQKRQIGSIQFIAESFFKSKQQLLELQEQKKALTNHENEKKSPPRKVVVQQKNGQIIINSILGKLELFNQDLIYKKNMALEVKLGKNSQFSTVLQNPGKQLIFIDTFAFKRTWEQTIKFVIELHGKNKEKIPTFFSEVNLRQLFEVGRLVSKKIKLVDDSKNYCGQLVLDMQYRQIEESKPPKDKNIKDDLRSISQNEQSRMKLKREEIQNRMKKREQEKKKVNVKEYSTLAVLQENDIILPPLRAARRDTLSPKPTKGANIYNSNGALKFGRSPRFNHSKDSSHESLLFVRESDFDPSKRRGSSIGRSDKYDFTKQYERTPGIGRYEIPSLWDKYH